MYNFSQIAVKLLRDYKAIIKKQFSAEEAEQKLAEFQLDKRLPTKESALYTLLERIAQKASEYDNLPQSRLRYCGNKQLIEHIKKILDLYCMQNKRVVNSAQLTSRAMIDAIQLMALSKARRTDDVVAKLHACSSTIAQNGSEEQKKIFLNSLHSYSARDSFFKSFLDYFSKSTEQYNYSVEEAVL